MILVILLYGYGVLQLLLYWLNKNDLKSVAKWTDSDKKTKKIEYHKSRISSCINGFAICFVVGTILLIQKLFL